ncbi:MAG: hypothetical protein AAF385_12565 [Pseudomonadota bacterium]
MSSSHIFVLGIIAIVFGSKILTDYLKSQRLRKDSQPDEQTEELLRRIDTLEDRVRVLEQIVTDPRESLSRKISNL